MSGALASSVRHVSFTMTLSASMPNALLMSVTVTMSALIVSTLSSDHFTSTIVATSMSGCLPKLPHLDCNHPLIWFALVNYILVMSTIMNDDTCFMCLISHLYAYLELTSASIMSPPPPSTYEKTKRLRLLINYHIHLKRR